MIMQYASSLSKYSRLLKGISILWLTIFAMFTSLAQTPFSTIVYDVKEYAAKGNGKTHVIKAINKTIEAAAAVGGGIVYFAPGIYLSTSIHLKSNITLYLEAGATIEAVSDSIAKYDLPEPNPTPGNFQDYGHSHWKNSLL